MAASSSMTPPQPIYGYDVFLSFRGVDTRNGFTSHLFKMLELHGIKTFMDDACLEAGDEIELLFNHIDNSEMFVVILSENYGNSTWCLREISKIVKTGRHIIPVFIKVDPADVKKQEGAFGASYNKKIKHETAENIEEWHKALKAVGERKGLVLNDNGNEAAIVELITKDVVRRVKKPMDVAKHPVAIESLVQDVLRRLPEDREEKVSILAISGMGGIGKSTLARGIYNHLMKDFDACGFLLNVRATTAKDYKGIVSLQKQLIRAILKKDQNLTVNDVDEGKDEIKRILHRRKVLLVLDDVDHQDQLEALAAEKGWFSNRSIVIVTTRNNSIVRDHYQSDECLLYQPQGLDKHQSMLLFSLHAFMTYKPPVAYQEISSKFVKVAHGLPLALTIYGSQLFGKRGNMEYWVEFLKLLEKTPHEDLVKRLWLSCDSLTDKEKEVFFDIAKFYVGEKTEYPMYIWEARGLSPTIIIQTLVERNIIRIEKQKRSWGFPCFGCMTIYGKWPNAS